MLFTSRRRIEPAWQVHDSDPGGVPRTIAGYLDVAAQHTVDLTGITRSERLAAVDDSLGMVAENRPCCTSAEARDQYLELLVSEILQPMRVGIEHFVRLVGDDEVKGDDLRDVNLGYHCSLLHVVFLRLTTLWRFARGPANCQAHFRQRE